MTIMEGLSFVRDEELTNMARLNQRNRMSSSREGHGQGCAALPRTQNQGIVLLDGTHGSLIRCECVCFAS